MGTTPSIERLRQTLSNVTWRETLGKATGIVTALNDQGDRIPFFCVHSLTGKATDYVQLARQLGCEQPFYSIQIPAANRSPDLGGLIGPFSIPALAKHYVDAINEFHPQGPVALGGWSIGAIIALEMAQQLRAHGRDVPLLVAIDMIPWNHGFPPRSSIARRVDIAMHCIPWLASHQLVKDGLRLDELNKRTRIKIASLAARLAGRPIPPKEEQVSDLVDISKYAPAHVALMEQLFECAKAYVPRRYDGKVQIYVARTEVALTHQSRLRWGWRHIAPHSRIETVSGAHQTLFDGPKAENLTTHLAAQLAALTLAARPA